MFHHSEATEESRQKAPEPLWFNRARHQASSVRGVEATPSAHIVGTRERPDISSARVEVPGDAQGSSLPGGTRKCGEEAHRKIWREIAFQALLLLRRQSTSAISGVWTAEWVIFLPGKASRVHSTGFWAPSRFSSSRDQASGPGDIVARDTQIREK
ncbi:hypothetical protein BOTBODRAFT_640516 [Botryobasidium botryosum FD-172 SS1]|uniref:Uncharacterized protein n=1 Tax=Botryobasidium botryosum (strain FD-172 SS1) TaxID=930990 RepID=A0A067MFB4_BOTB1|nr:hypothetical protein BOTBODRAFT_640516 [Botryobasidium botryosum FD-172 SS1]